MKPLDTLIHACLVVIVAKRDPAHIEIVCFGIDRPCLGASQLLSWRKPQPDLPGDLAGYLVLHHYQVFQLPLKTLRPKMPVILRFNELRCNPDVVTRTHHRAFHQRVDMKFTRNLWCALAFGAILHRRDSRYHAKSRHLRQFGGQFLSHAIGEIVLRRISREVFEWQHRQGLNCGSRGGSSHPFEDSLRAQHSENGHSGRHQTAQEPPDERLAAIGWLSLLQTSTPLVPPGLNLAFIGIDGRLFLVHLPVDWQTLRFPTADGALVAL